MRCCGGSDGVRMRVRPAKAVAAGSTFMRTRRAQCVSLRAVMAVVYRSAYALPEPLQRRKTQWRCISATVLLERVVK